MSDVTITINGRILERILYWVIIVVLAVLLVLSYLGDDGGSTTKTTEESGSAAANTDDGSVEIITPDQQEIPEEDPEPLPSPDETCFDGEKNQDEIGPDCGGTCADINGAFYYDGKCHDDPKPKEDDPEDNLDGKITFSITDVDEQKAPGDGTTALKVKSFKVKISNGKPDNLFPVIKAYAKTTGGSYLNQFGDAEDDYTAYMGPVDVGKLAPGESITVTVDEAGSYIFEQAGYDLGEDFKLVVDLLDSEGDKIDQATKTVKG